MPSVNSSSRPSVWPSSTFTTPSLPTFSIASAMTSPISRSLVEFVATGAVSSLPERAPRVLVELELFVSHIAFVPPRDSLDRGAIADDLGENVRLPQDQDLVGPELDLGAAVLGEDDLVTLVQVHLDVLAVLVPRAGADSQDAAALRLLLGGIRQHDAADGRL